VEAADLFFSLALLTSPNEVDDFLGADIDMLAPSVGNIHGDYPPAGPQLDIERLSSVAKQIHGRAHLVLHGTNDFSPELTQRCVAAGVTKLNVNKLLLWTWSDFIAKNASLPITQLIDGGIEAVQRETERWMHVCGSAGKA
jgi:fructose-bisphosphate aldolase, class II